jgi:uncharacterized protein YeaO (DUF488 family)
MFHHDPRRRLEFCKRYKAELKSSILQTKIAETPQAACKHFTTNLIYAAKDTEHNEAVALRASKGECANANSRFSRRRHDDRRSGAI